MPQINAQSLQFDGLTAGRLGLDLDVARAYGGLLMNSDDTIEFLTDDEAKAALQEAVDVVQDVLGMMRLTLKSTSAEDANFLHKAEMQTQRLRVEHDGVKPNERSVLRAHPLFRLWQLAMKAAAQLERLLSVTNPQLFAQRAVTLDAARELAKAERTAAKSRGAA